MKKVLSIILAVIVLMTSVSLIATTVSATEPKIWDGTIASSFASGTGLADDPFIIETAEQLAYLANSTLTFSQKYIKLANDIYLNDTANWEDWETNPPANEWTPIGTISGKFSGYFDGDNHTIYGLYCANKEYAALFYQGGNISNTTVKDSYIYATECAGAISAYNSTTIKNCHNYATVKGDNFAGGIAALKSDDGDITLCSNHGTVSGKIAGGILASKKAVADITITQSYNTGNIQATQYAGGIIGTYYPKKIGNDGDYYFCEISYLCYNSGTISGPYAGGICGCIEDFQQYRMYGNYYLFDSCFNVGIINGSEYTGHIIGYCGTYYCVADEKDHIIVNDACYNYYYNSSSILQYSVGNYEWDYYGYEPLSTQQAISQEAYEGFDFNTVWTMDGNIDFPYPKLRNNFQTHVHSFVADTTAKCTEDVTATYTCHCGDFYTEILPATGHNHIESITTEATCTTAGLKTYTCHCGDTYTETIVAPGHSISTVTANPTCTEDGETYEACSVCGDVFGDKTPIPATGHSHSEEITTKATCTTAGLKTFTCSCGDTYTEAILATGHKLKLVTNAATCTSSGTQYNLCENCGNIIGETTLLPITGHNYATETQNATCTKDGLITYTCSCGDTYTETIPATGHSYTEEIKREPTCTASGIKWLTCSCGNRKTEQIPATGHDVVTDKAVTPTCTETGLTEGSHCNTCGATITAQEIIPANGHSYEEKTVTQATCTTDGLKEFTCHCGDSYTETISKIAHSFGEWEYVSENIYQRKCTECDEGIENKSVFLTLDKSSVNITNQSSYTLTATVTDNFTDDIVFTSSNSDVASVNSDGKVIAENIGSATVTATIRDTSISAVCTVNVTPRQFTVTWIVDGVENVQTLNENAQITKPENPQKDGYKFVGWTPSVPQTMPAYNLTFTAVFEELYTCPHCGTEFDKENEYNVHIKEEQKEIAINKASIKIQNNPTSRTIKYGETLKLTATVSNMPEGSKIAWYVDGSKKAEGQTFSVSPSSGTVTVTVKLIDSDGNVLVNSSGNEISDSQKVSVDSGFFQKIISFFKNLFGMNRTITQAFKGMF